MSRPTVIVVPCYNEAARLRADEFQEFASSQSCVRFLFVNDGSTDLTATVLERLSSGAPHSFEVLDLPRNRGKAFAVREGMLRAFASNATFAGYWDADLATPLREIPRFIEALETSPERQICMGARVQLLGRVIERRATRHYMGRVFATAASLTLQLPVYDTQCGAKLFRVTPVTRALFAAPFITSWCFDVELIARLVRDGRSAAGPTAAELIYELPLEEWRDVAGSKVRPADFMRAFVEIIRIRRSYMS